MKPMPLASQKSMTASMLADHEVVVVLDGDDFEVGLRGDDLGDRDLAQADMPDQALLLHLGDDLELLVARDGRVDAMQLPEVDALEAQVAKAEEHLLVAGNRAARTAPRAFASGGRNRPWWRPACLNRGATPRGSSARWCAGRSCRRCR